MNKKDEIIVEPKRGRGRPKGTGGNKRPDCSPVLAPGDATNMIMHSMHLYELTKPDMTNVKEVEKRVSDYFYICANDDVKPGLAGLALAFGVSRKTLYGWCNGLESKFMPQEVRDTLKKAYLLLDNQMEQMMQTGHINPVSGIFLMKNNYGYQDKQEVVLTPNQQQEQMSAAELEQKYLSDVLGAEETESEN